eukprot:ctg_769.g370
MPPPTTSSTCWNATAAGAVRPAGELRAHQRPLGLEFGRASGGGVAQTEPHPSVHQTQRRDSRLRRARSAAQRAGALHGGRALPPHPPHAGPGDEVRVGVGLVGQVLAAESRSGARSAR